MNWFMTFSEDYFDATKITHFYVSFNMSCFDDKRHYIFADKMIVSRGYETEDDARLVLHKFMQTMVQRNVNFFIEN